MEKTLAGLYFILFNAITSAVEELEKSPVTTPETIKAIEILKNAQVTTEEMYINVSSRGK